MNWERTEKYNISYYFTVIQMFVTLNIPNDSAPPGHFCMATSPLVANGHEIFQIASFSRKHIEVSTYNNFRDCFNVSL